MIGLDVTSISAIQNFLLSNLTSGFSIITVYAQHLLYYFIAFEIIFAGLGWMLYQSNYAERLLFQIIKIGLILFLVNNFVDIINSILQSISAIGEQLSQSNTQHLLLNPGLVWQYGYNYSISLLHTATLSSGFALPMIFLVLGFGTLLVIGIFGIQIFIQVAGFYLVAAVSLLILPLAVFSPLKDFFSTSMKSILQAAVRLIIQMLIVAVAMETWSVMKLQNYTPEMNINGPLGFLFSGMLFVMASIYLPRLVEKVIGSIQWQAMPIVSQAIVTVNGAPSAQSSGGGANMGTSSNVAAIQAAASMVSMGAAQQVAMLSQTNAAPQTYVKAVEKDFLAKRSADSGLMSRLLFADQEDKDHEEIRKLKQAFYEILNELKEK